MNLFKNWTFRSARPSFTVGEELRVYLTSVDATTGRAEARIGDSILEVSGARPEQLDELVTLEIETFDDQTHRGTARVAAA